MLRTAAARAALLAILALPGTARAQEARWALDGSVGYVGLVDDATDHLLLTGGSGRVYVSPRISLGPEFVVMTGAGRGDGPDRALMLTGNLVFDLLALPVGGPRQVTPYLLGGLGFYWQRQLLLTGPFWSNDPAFTAGGGVRARVGPRMLVAGEYRVGWELHQRISGTVTFELR